VFTFHPLQEATLEQSAALTGGAQTVFPNSRCSWP
jgi:hypothetical protein